MGFEQASGISSFLLYVGVLTTPLPLIHDEWMKNTEPTMTKSASNTMTLPRQGKYPPVTLLLRKRIMSELSHTLWMTD